MAHSRCPIPGLETGSGLRKEFSTRTKALAFQRANGKCDGCGIRLQPGRIAYDHVVPDGLNGDTGIDNCAVLCTPCHKQKTRGDVGNIAKAKRREARHIGAHKSRNPLPGGKLSKWRKKLTGEVVRR
jgi:5-methylcytosine-specific restriction protein A